METGPLGQVYACLWTFSREVQAVNCRSLSINSDGISLDVQPLPSTYLLWNLSSISIYSRRAELFDALSNEAMHQRGKGGLINHLYLLHGHGPRVETGFCSVKVCLSASSA